MDDRINNADDIAAVLAAVFTRGSPGENPFMFKYTCECGKHLLSPVTTSGRKGYCPKCKKGVTVPRRGSANILAVRCSCGTDIPINNETGGKIECPACSNTVVLRQPKRLLSPVVQGLIIAVPIAVIILIIYIFLIAE